MTSRHRKRLLLTSCLLLLVLVVSLQAVQAMVPGAVPRPQSDTASPPVLVIDHDLDLSEYNRIVIGGGGLARTSAAALAGTAGGLEVRLGGTQPIYAQANFAPLTSPRYRFRFYLDPNGLTMNYRSIQNVVALYDARQAEKVWVIMRYRNGRYQIRAAARDDTYNVHKTAWHRISDDEHYIEVLVEHASSSTASDGRVALWIDGKRKKPIAKIDLYDLDKPALLRMGSNWVTQDKTSGTYYLDEFVLRNDDIEIGPDTEQNPPQPTATNAPTQSPTPTPTTPPPQTPTPTVAPGLDGELIVRHEESLAEYNTVVHDGGDLVQSTAAALGGTQGGMQATIDDDAALFGEKASTALDDAQAYRFRHYLHPNGLVMPDRSQITLAQVRRGGNKVVTRLQYIQASGYGLYVRYVDDNGTWRSMPMVSISSDEHYLEVLVEFASGPSANDGRITYWLDNVRIAQHRDLDLYDPSERPNHVRLGVPWVSDPAIRGTLYLDEFVLRPDNQPIGPILSQPTPTPTTEATQAATPTPTPTATQPPTATPTNTPPPTLPPTATPTNTPPPTATPVPAALLLNVRHENNLSEYDGLVAGGTNLRQSSNAALAGTAGGLQATVSGTSAIYGTKAFGDLGGTAYRFRFYVDPNGISLPNNGQITLAQLRRGGNHLVTRLQYRDGQYRLYVRFVDDNDGWHNTAFTPISDAEHYVEVLVEFASSSSANDGRVIYWVDDTLAGQVARQDLYALSRRPNEVRLGAAWISQPETNGTLYLDELVLNNNGQYIGPVSSSGGPEPPPATPTATPPAPPPATPTATPPSTLPSQHIAINLQAQRQTIREIGGGNFIHRSQNVTVPVEPVSALNLEVLDPRVVRVRMNLQEWEPTNDNANPNTFNWAAYRDEEYVSATFGLLQILSEHETTLVASIWTAPHWMIEDTSLTVKRRVKPEYYPEFIETIVAWLLRARNEYGVEVDYISLNEPDLGVYILIPPTDYARLIAQTGERMRAAGLNTRWLLADATLRNCQTYASTIWAYAEARPYLGPLACHMWDHQRVSDETLANLGQYARQIGREFWIAEAHWKIWLDPALYPTWDNALNLAAAYTRMLRQGEVSAFFYWQMISNGYSTNDGTNPYPILDILAQFKHEIPAGSRIVETSPTTGTLYTLAAEAPSHFALLMVNTDTQTEPVQITDLPHGTYYHIVSSARGTLRLAQTVNVTSSSIQLNLGPQSVNVLTTQPPAQ